MFHFFDTATEKILPLWLYQGLFGRWNKEGIMKYLSNTGWIFLGKSGSLLISFIATFYIARYLGPSNFGELSYALSFVAIFSFIASFGIDAVLYRELIAKPEKRNELMGSAMAIKLATSLLAILVTIISAYFFSPKDVSFWLIIILSLSFFFQSTFIINYEFGAAVKAKKISILSLSINLAINIAKIAVIFLEQGVLFLALILVCESIFYAVGYLYLRYKTFGSLLNWKFNSSVTKSLLYDSWPFIFSGAFALVYARIDQIMLKHIIDATSVGIYDAAVRLAELWYFIPVVIVGSLFPALVNAKQHSIHEYKKRTLLLFLLISALAITIAAIVTITAKPLVGLVFGELFLDSAIVLQVYIWALVPISLITLFNNVLLAENAKKILFVSALLGMSINIFGNYLLIPTHQAFGAAIATLISSAIMSIFLMIYCVYLYKKLNNATI